MFPPDDFELPQLGVQLAVLLAQGGRLGAEVLEVVGQPAVEVPGPGSRFARASQLSVVAPAVPIPLALQGRYPLQQV